MSVIIIGIAGGILLFVLLGRDHSVRPSSGTHYYIRQVRQSTFFAGEDNSVRLSSFDTSHAIFNNDMTRMAVNFADGRTYTFIVRDFRISGGTFNANLRGVIMGTVLDMRLTSDNDFITIRSDRYMDVVIETAGDDGGYAQTISRDSMLLQFRRTPPSWRVT